MELHPPRQILEELLAKYGSLTVLEKRTGGLNSARLPVL
jgi:hypothetical protein